MTHFTDTVTIWDVIGHHRQAIDRQAIAIQLTTPLLLRKPCTLFASVARVCQRQLSFLVGMGARHWAYRILHLCVKSCLKFAQMKKGREKFEPSFVKQLVVITYYSHSRLITAATYIGYGLKYSLVGESAHTIYGDLIHSTIRIFMAQWKRKSLCARVRPWLHVK